MKNEKFNEILHNALQVQKEMEKREKLYTEECKTVEWISASKTLPMKTGEYLCWYEYYHWNKEKILPEYGIGYYDSDFNFWGGEVANGKDAKVLAWMPLPDPYKGE